MFKKKVQEHLFPRGPYALIEWKPAAKKYCVGGDAMKWIVLYNERGETIDVYELTKLRIKKLEESGIPVIDITQGQELPINCLSRLESIHPMGVLWGVEE